MMEPSEHDCLHWQADMESLPVGWTLHTCDQEGGSSGLLRGADPDSGAVTHVCDLFHEDAQVGNRTIGNQTLISKISAASLELFYSENRDSLPAAWPLDALCWHLALE